MEIRRKVFSAIEDEDGEVRLYSTVDVDSYNYNDDYDYVESLYSNAFADGYEYAQREFAEREEKDNKSVMRNTGIAAGLTIPVAALATGSLDHANTYKTASDKLKKSLKDLHSSNRDLIRFNKSGSLEAAEKNLEDLENKKWNNTFRKKGEDSLTYDGFDEAFDKAGHVDPSEIERRKKVASDFEEKLKSANRKYNSVLSDKKGLEGMLNNNLKKAKDLKTARINAKKGLIKSLGKTAIAGGLAAGGVAAYNHFKDNYKKIDNK